MLRDGSPYMFFIYFQLMTRSPHCTLNWLLPSSSRVDVSLALTPNPPAGSICEDIGQNACSVQSRRYGLWPAVDSIACPKEGFVRSQCFSLRKHGRLGFRTCW